MLIRGKAKWAKVTGAPHFGYEDKFKEWSIDVYPEEESLERLIAEGLKDKIKDKGNGPYITFKRKELKADGSPNQPIRIVDHQGDVLQDKDTPCKLKIGNGSIVNVNFAINDYSKTQKNVAILSMQIWDLVKFEGGEFPTKEANESSDWAEDAA